MKDDYSEIDLKSFPKSHDNIGDVLNISSSKGRKKVKIIDKHHGKNGEMIIETEPFDDSEDKK